MRAIALVLITVSLLLSSVTKTKKEIQQTKYYISKMNAKLDKLVNEIRKKQKSIESLNAQIAKLNKEIESLSGSLKDAKQLLGELSDLKHGYINKQEEIKKEILDFLANNYYLDTQEIDNVNDLIYNELTKKILQAKSEKIAKLIKLSKSLNQNIQSVSQKIENIKNRQKLLQSKKNALLKLLKKRKKEVLTLNYQKFQYKKKLQNLIKKQKALQAQLEKLKIIKKRNYSANYNIPTATYKGEKTIAPLAGKVVKKFGSYIDPIYKIRVYNDSITIKPYKPNALVRAIMPGKIVYIGENSGKKIIVIKHKGDIFSIYANLDKISPLIKKGYFVKRGQIIARVQNALEFEVTYKEKPINPLKVINLR